jgi:hypothetical protein
VSGIDNHAMDPGSLYLNERIPGAPYTDLNERGHRIGIPKQMEQRVPPRHYPRTARRILTAGA